MDPMTIYAILAAAVFFVICYTLFSVATRESSFEETYSKSKLVASEDKKPKAKNVGKAKKPTKVERKPTVDKQEAPVVEPTTSEQTEVSPPKQSAVAEKSDVSAEQSKDAAKKNKKRTKKVDSVDSNSGITSSAEEAHNVPVEKPVEKPIEKKTVVQESAQPKARGKRDTSNPTNVNMEKLIERLGASEDIGPEYLSFICQYAEQVKQKESKFNESVSKLQKEVSSKNYEIEQLHEQLYTAQLTFGKVQSLEQALKDENQKYKIFVDSVTPKLSENQQLRETNRTLEGQLNSQANQFASKIEKMKRDSEQVVSQLRNALTQSNNLVHQKEGQIKQLEDELRQKDSVFTEKENEFGQHSGLIEELKEAVLEKDRYIEQIQKELTEKVNTAERQIEELKHKEQQIILEKDEQIALANGKLEAELKESLLRIDELRSKNYKLVDSINTLYKYNQTNENKKPVDQEISA